jgi:hypothetical protein
MANPHNLTAEAGTWKSMLDSNQALLPRKSGHDVLRDADELLDGQYRDHPNLRPIANTLLAWAAARPGVAIRMRKGYVPLHSKRRKFAQVTGQTTRQWM